MPKNKAFSPQGSLAGSATCNQEAFVLHWELQVFTQCLGLPGLLERRRQERPSAYRNSQALNTYLASRRLLKGSREYRTNKDRNISPGFREEENEGGFKQSKT